MLVVNYNFYTHDFFLSFKAFFVVENIMDTSKGMASVVLGMKNKS